MSDLERLAKPFPDRVVSKPPKGKYGDYVAHHVVNQWLLAVVGPFNLQVVRELYGESGLIEGALVRLECMVDGIPVTIEEAGDCERPDNWNTQGARLKDAVSDGLKRCAMRLGLGLHLWSQGDYVLPQLFDAKKGS